jgi:hypothetical protein
MDVTVLKIDAFLAAIFQWIIRAHLVSTFNFHISSPI